MHFIDRADDALTFPRAVKSCIPLVVMVLTICAAAAFAPQRAQAQHAVPVIIVNDVELPTDEDPLLRDLTVFLPLDRSTLSALGAVIGIVSCAGKECFTISAMGKDVSFVLGETKLTVDGRSYEAGAACFRDHGTLFVPAPTLFEALGMKPHWDEKNATLTVTAATEPPPAYEKLASVIKLTQPEAEKQPETAATETAARFQASTPRMGYTYENQTRLLSIGVSGDKTQSSSEEKGDVYNNFSIRFLGTLRNGYEFQSSIKTTETTDTQGKKGELNKFELGWTKNKISLSAYDIQPKFSKYIFRSYPMQGVNYRREGNAITVQGVFGKAMKRMRASNYARYLAGVRVEHTFNKPTDTGKDTGSQSKTAAPKKKQTHPIVLGASIAQSRDTGGIVDLKKLDNITYSADILADLKKPWILKGEMASSFAHNFTGDNSRGTARTFELNYVNRRVNWKNFYERNSADFYSETSYFSRGRTEFSSLYTRKFNPRLTGGSGFKMKLIGTAKTYIYPTNIQVSPFGKRSTTFTLLRNFEKTVAAGGKIRDSREFRVSDIFGKTRVDSSFERRKQKDASEHAYRNKYALTIQSPVSEKMEIEAKYNRERWYHDRVSITRQEDLRATYEIAPWTEMSLGAGRYYNTPGNAFTRLRLGFQKMDIINDREIRATYEFQNYRDYNVNMIELSYNFFK